MPPATIHSPPELDSFTSLADHQSQTPASFYGAKPVLHYHTVGLRAVAPSGTASKLPIFRQGDESAAAEASTADPESQEGSNDTTVTEIVDAFINSENLTLFNHSKSIGVSIPYPAISLHAIQTSPDPTDSSQQVQGLYIQLELSDRPDSNDDDSFDFVEVTLFPSAPSAEDTTATIAPSDIKAIFEAVANCSNLHPNPSSDADEEMDEDGAADRIVFEGSVGYDGISGLPGVQRGTADGGLPPPFPGSGGWITAENVSEYFDEDGNYIGGGAGGDAEALGEGAGRVRTRDEADGEEGLNGHNRDDADDHKRPRAE